jgi:dihydrofolate synthase/folylpolyglutamate synthase
MEWKVDVGIVEANIGLRFDPAGAVPAALTVLTPIATDHAQLLRPPPEWEHLGAAAGPLWHKLSKVPSDRVVVGRQPGADPTTVDALVSRPGPRFGRDFRLLDVRSGLWGSRADVVLPGGQRTALELTCLGAFQAENALTAAAAYLELGHTDLEAMRQGALRCQIPGRLQVVGQDPLRLLCVASSKAKVEGLLDSLEPLFENAESGMVMVLTLLDRVHARDEVIDYIARHPRLRALIATQGTYADDSRDLPPWQVADLARQAHPGLTIESEADPSVALRRAEAVLQPGDIMVLLGNGLAAFLAGSEALAVKGEIGASPGDR